MRAEQFDELTRRYANGSLNRREALKRLLGSAFAAQLGWLGLRQTSATAALPQQQPGSIKVFLPMAQRTCTTASRCGSRVYCDEKQGCLCVQATEGDIRCGKLPDCGSKLCKSSADCASLGEGAFCDTPLSGCCSSPPNTLSRCLLPCPPCPAERLCNTSCCAEGQVCRQGKCATPELCDSDPITDASMAAAQAAYAAGATDIALSANGCQRYTRTDSSNRRIEKMTLGGFTVLLTDTSPVQSVTYYDNDQDAFYEADTTVVANSSTKQLRSRTLNRYDPLTKRKIGRRFENRRDETTMDVTVEEWDTTGALILREQFVDSLVVVFPNGDVSAQGQASGAARSGRAPSAAGPCAAPDLTMLQSRLSEGMEIGAKCLEKYKHPSAKAYRQFQAKLKAGKVTFLCDAGFTDYAQATSGSFPDGPVTITANPTQLRSPGASVLLSGESADQFQRRVLFHETVHFMMDAAGDHQARTRNYSQFDPTNACHRLCFDPNANQCHCQTCLGSKTCTGACKGLPACNSSIQDCGTRCCVGPCDGTSCCPSDRICSKKSNETAICCKPNETCINQPGGASSCCAGLVCGDPEKENEICCPPGTTCGTDPAGNPTCKTPQIYCPACPAKGRALQCFNVNQAALCQTACSGTLGCPTSCQTDTTGICP